MTLTSAFKVAKKFAMENSPAILTSLGVVGTISTAVLTGKAVLHADRILQAELYKVDDYNQIVETGKDLSKRDMFDLVWREFIPPVAVGVATVTMILGANHVGARRAAAMAAGFQVVEQMAGEYREKVVSTIGKKAEEDIRAKLGADRIEKIPNPPSIIFAGPQSVFFDAWSGQYFNADFETVRKAMNDINFQINNDFFATVTDFYNMVGLDETGTSGEFGWNSDNMMDIQFTAILDKNNRPIIQIEYNKQPIHGYDRLR